MRKSRRSIASALLLVIGGGFAALFLLGLGATALWGRQSVQAVDTVTSLPTKTASWTSTSTITATLLPATYTPTALPSATSLPALPSPTRLPVLGGRIAFTCTPGLYNQMCLVTPDGSGYTQLTNHKANDYYPTLGADGWLYFVSNRSTVFEIYALEIEGGALRQLSQRVGNPTAPEPSPDGQQIVFANKVEGDSSIWLANHDGSDPHPITGGEHNEIDPTWSPDGRQIAFASARGGYVELWIMQADGSDLRQVTSGVPAIGGRSSWSPDGARLVFYAGPKGDRNVYVVEITSGVTTRLTHGGNNTGPCFSPDGEWIAFSSSRDGDHEIYVMRTDGSGVRQLTHNEIDDWQPRWGK